MLPTWDLVLVVFFAASLVYGFLMGKDKIMVSILGAYVGLVIANQWGATVFDWMFKQSGTFNVSWLHGNLSVFLVKIGLFAAVLLIIATKGNWLCRIPAAGIFGMVMPMLYSMLNATLIAASVLDFLPDETRRQVIEKSIIAAPLVTYHSWWLILPVLLIFVSGWFVRE